MQKKNFVKLFLALMVIAVLTLFLSGCTANDETIVHIRIINDDEEYDIHVDGVLHGTTHWTGNLLLGSVSTGYRHFEAIYQNMMYGDKWQNIVPGQNTVEIQVYPVY